MSMEIFTDIEQGTPEWHACRIGIPTASMFATVMANGRGGGESKTRRKYMLQLAGEQLTGQLMETYSNGDMKRGKAMEAEAREFYAFQNDAEPVKVGFVRNGSEFNRYGCSPDSFVGTNGLLEIKTAKPDVLIEIIDRPGGTLPPEHKAQVQGQLWVCEREHLDFVAYWPKMPKCIRRVYRDEAYIAGLASAVSDFNAELYELVQRLDKLRAER
jgi:hypothetical protein